MSVFVRRKTNLRRAPVLPSGYTGRRLRCDSLHPAAWLLDSRHLIDEALTIRENNLAGIYDLVIKLEHGVVPSEYNPQAVAVLAAHLLICYHNETGNGRRLLERTPELASVIQRYAKSTSTFDTVFNNDGSYIGKEIQHVRHHPPNSGVENTSGQSPDQSSAVA